MSESNTIRSHLEKLRQKAREKEKQFLSNCREVFINIYDQKKEAKGLTVEEYNELTKSGANSYERYLLMEVANQELIIWLIREYLKNASVDRFDKAANFTLYSTYDEVLSKYLIHKL